MTHSSDFPIGGLIEHNGHDLHISRLLSDKGLTSRVYEGWLEDENSDKLHVAIKSMKHLDFSMAHRAFREEGATLASLMHYEKLANQDQRIDLNVIPTYFGSGEYNEVPYLVMDFVSGSEIPDLIEKEGGKLPEEKALTIGWHLFRTLDILHTNLKKSYADLKYENLWWVPAKEGVSDGYLKMMDFGTMEEIRFKDGLSKGIQRDLLQAGIYLCHMLVGQLPNFSMSGFLKERAEPIIRNAKISWGSKQILFQLLHRNPQARPKSAAELVSDLRPMVSFWKQPTKDIMGLVQQLLTRGEAGEDSSKAHDLAFRARAALDIIQIRKPEIEGIQGDIKRAEKLLSISNYLERGKTLLTTRSPDLARKILEEGMHWSNDPGVLRRWSYLARVGEEISPKVFDEHLPAAMEMVEWMNEGDWSHALERLEGLRSSLSSHGLEMLFNDIKMFENINAAQAAISGGQKDYLKAAEYFRKAMSWMSKLPDQEFIKEEEEGDLYLQARDMEIHHKTEGEARFCISEAKTLLEGSDPDLENVLLKVEEAVNLDSENVIIVEDIENLLKISLQNRRFSLAFQVAGIGLKRGIENSTFFSYFQLSRQLREAEQALLSNKKDDFLTTLREIKTSFESNSVAVESIKYLRDRAGQNALESRDSDWLKALAQFADELNDWDQAKIWRSEANRLFGQREDSVREMIDRLISDSTCLLQINEFSLDDVESLGSRYTATKMIALLNQEHLRLSRINQMVSDAEQLVKEIDHRSEDVSALRNRINKLLETSDEQYEELTSTSKADRDSRLEILDRLWNRLKTFLEWARKAEAAGARGVTIRQIADQVEEEAIELIRQCQMYLSTIDQSNTHVKNLLNEIYLAVDNLGAQGWQTLRELANKHTQNVQIDFEKAQKAFEQGDIEKVLSEINILATDYFMAPEFIRLKERVVQIEMMKAWQNENEIGSVPIVSSPKMLKKIRGFLSLDLPSVYYRKIQENLYNTYQVAQKRVEDQLGDPNRPEFLNALRFWVNVDLTIKLLELRGNRAYG